MNRVSMGLGGSFHGNISIHVYCQEGHDAFTLTETSDFDTETRRYRADVSPNKEDYIGVV